MYLIIALGALSFLLSYILVPLIRDHVGHLGFLDHPDGIRKKHVGAVPRVGGIAIALAYVATFAIAFILPFSYTQILHNEYTSIWKLTLVASVVFLTGVIDDLIGLNAWQKMAGIGAAGVLAFLAGIRVDLHLIPWVAAYPWLGFAITVIWLVGCTNAFNLIDGMDGLAAGVGLFASGTILLAALVQHNLPLALASMPLVGCLIAFLRYNFNPASVFLGDSGSLLIGFLLACFGALWSQKSVTLIAMLAPVLAVSIPLLDVALSITRRFLRKRPIFQGDRGHIHHKLLDRGFSQRATVLVIYAVCFLAALVSLLVSALHNQFSGFIIFLFGIPVWIGIQYLGYPEFAKAARIFLKGGFRQIIDAEARLHDFESALAKATDMDECWTTILKGSREFGFQGVRMSVAGTVWEESTCWSSKTFWQLRIPLTGTHYINFYRDFNKQIDHLILSAFVDCVSRALQENLAGEEHAVTPVAARAELVYAASAVATGAASGTS